MIHKVLIFFISNFDATLLLLFLHFFLFHSRSLGNESYSFWRFCELLCPAMRLTFDNKMLQQLFDKMQ